ncbi:MAG: hypothetical protein A3J24_07945 [Deltaproteobacteria bacterium RIFCSPLOWO2_02_FULL_53_8]|nr:MAG: hypothetical protein A3J24_07945 [Deltaproteobacteria bacterium RIFCSPLOWO2_02_FULL_53_8]
MFRQKYTIFVLAFILLASVSASAEPVYDTLRVPLPASVKDGELDGWSVQNWKGRSEINLVDTDAGKALHLKSKASSTAIYKDMEIDVNEYRYVNWKWKVVSVPKGGDVRRKKADDQAGQLYVIFPKWPSSINSRLLGYIWDTTAPAGLKLTSTKMSTTKYVVVKSGSKELGVWHTERRNVYEDFQALFGNEKLKAGRVSIMIDSDDTDSSAELFITDIYFSRN